MFLIVISKQIWGDAFRHQEKVPQEFPQKKGTWGNVSPSWEHGGARKRVPHPRGKSSWNTGGKQSLVVAQGRSENIKRYLADKNKEDFSYGRKS